MRVNHNRDMVCKHRITPAQGAGRGGGTGAGAAEAAPPTRPHGRTSPVGSLRRGPSRSACNTKFELAWYLYRVLRIFASAMAGSGAQGKKVKKTGPPGETRCQLRIHPSALHAYHPGGLVTLCALACLPPEPRTLRSLLLVLLPVL